MSWAVIVICIAAAVFLILAGLLIFVSIVVIDEKDRGVVLTFGRYAGTRKPGLRFVLPVIQQMELVDIRERVIDTLPQALYTQDNVQITTNAVIYYKIVDPGKAILRVMDIETSIREMGQSLLLARVQQTPLDGLSSTTAIAADMLTVLAKEVKEWGGQVSNVVVKELEVDPSMVRALAREAEAAREAKAKIVESEAEKQVARNLVDAAEILQSSPAAMQLRHYEALTAISGNQAATVILPDIAKALGFGGGREMETGEEIVKMISQDPKAMKLLEHFAKKAANPA